MERSIRIMLSSALDEELEGTRESLKALIQSQSNHVLDFGDRTTGPETNGPMEASLEKVRECELFVILIGARVGPYTRAEWLEAVRLQRTILVLFANDQSDAARDQHVREVFAATDLLSNPDAGVAALTEQVVGTFDPKSEAWPILVAILKACLRIVQDESRAITTAGQIATELATYSSAYGHRTQSLEAQSPAYAEFVMEGEIGRELVCCFQSEVGFEDLSLLSTRASGGAYAGFRLVADRCSVQLERQAPDLGGQVQSVNRFLMSFIDIDDDFDQVLSISRRSHHDTDYVPLGCDKRVDWGRSGVVVEHQESISRYVQVWLESSDRQQLAVLGDFGSGKSWYCLALCKELMDRLTRNEPTRMPLLVTLKDVPVQADGTIDLFGHVQKMLGIALKSASLLTSLLQNGRLLVVLDGLDEFSTHHYFRDKASIMRGIAKLAVGKSKLVVTSRRAFFDDGTSEGVDLNDDPNQRDALQFEIVYLKAFSPSQIADRVRLRFPDDAESYLQRIRQTPHLEVLAERPIVLDMILDILEQTSEDEILTLAGIYDRCTKNWLREAARERSPLNEKQRLDLMGKLAWLLYARGDIAAEKDDLADLVDECMEEIDESFLLDPTVESTTRGETLLIRDGYGVYAFAHRSFLEYFVARRLYAAYLENRHEPFAEAYITPEVADFLVESDRHIDGQRLLDWLKQSESTETTLLAGNLLTLLNRLGMSLEEQDFSGLYVRRADLADARLRGASFRGATLDSVRLVRADMRDVDCRDARLQGLVLGVKSSAKAIACAISQPLCVGTNSNHEIFLIDLEGQKPLQTLGAHTDAINYLRFSRDGQTLVSVGFDRKLKVWDMRTFAHRKTLELPPCTTYAVGILQDYDTVLTGGDDNTVRGFSLTTGKEVFASDLHRRSVYCIATDAENGRFATASFDHNVCFWPLDAPHFGFRPLHHEMLDDHESLVNGVAFSPNGGELLASCDNLGSLHVRRWRGSSWAKPKRIRNAHEEQIWSVQFSPDGRFAATGSSDKTIAVWDCGDGWRELSRLSGHEGAVWNVAFDYTGTRLVSCSMDSTIRIWDWRHARELQCLGVGVLEDQGLQCQGMKMANAKGITPVQAETFRHLGAHISMEQSGNV